MIMICERMKWDYFTYLKQPTWFIDLLVMKFNEDARCENRKLKKIKKR